MKIGTRRSFVWDFFNKVANRNTVLCELCNKELTYYGSTTNLRNHLTRIHSLQVHEESLAHKDNINTSVNESENKCSSPTISGSVITVQGIPSTLKREPLEINLPAKRSRQQHSFAAQNNDLSLSDKKEIDDKLIRMIVCDFQPLSFVDNTSFREYTKILNPLYTIPDRKEISEVLLPNLFAEKTNHIKRILEETQYVSVTIECWSADDNRTNISVTTHFIYNDKMCSYTVATQEIVDLHINEKTYTTLLNIMQEWNIVEKVVCFVSAEMRIKSVIVDYLQKPYQFCVVHTLNSCVKLALQRNNPLSDTLEKCRTLVNYFKENAHLVEKLKNAQNELGHPQKTVKEDEMIGWNSSFLMIERLLEIKHALSVTLKHFPKLLEILNVDDWSVIKDCVEVLKPYKTLATILSRDQYCPISVIIPLLSGLKLSVQSIQPKTKVIEKLKADLIEFTNNRLGSLEQDDIVSKACFLDPRFKKVGFEFENNANSAQAKITDEITALMESQHTLDLPNPKVPLHNNAKDGNLWSFLDKKLADINSAPTPSTSAVLAINQYLDLPHLDRTKDPMEFWKKHETLLPELYVLANKYLCIPGTSVPAEQLYTKAGKLKKFRRNQLSKKNINVISFLESYFKLND